ncbi:hypothetical protein BRADI_3g14894v3 [Brachypodium distachyon]|uniref:Uncharacterized protein n=1 Tax=Brachypodium distachyon TaxID=15368 RepID=A0A2K2CX55_BRADI|nr:hypothetical protein BRADI_3g14894v3 [Brachypodium distachyon]
MHDLHGRSHASEHEFMFFTVPHLYTYNSLPAQLASHVFISFFPLSSPFGFSGHRSCGAVAAKQEEPTPVGFIDLPVTCLTECFRGAEGMGRRGTGPRGRPAGETAVPATAICLT